LGVKGLEGLNFGALKSMVLKEKKGLKKITQFWNVPEIINL
jgi:hypothetical protein